MDETQRQKLLAAADAQRSNKGNVPLKAQDLVWIVEQIGDVAEADHPKLDAFRAAADVQLGDVHVIIRAADFCWLVDQALSQSQ